MFIVYTIYNKKYKKIYIGQTTNIISRLSLHNNKTFKNCYTSRYDGEWQLIYSESFNSRKEAIIREKQLRSYQGRQFFKQFIPE